MYKWIVGVFVALAVAWAAFTDVAGAARSAAPATVISFVTYNVSNNHPKPSAIVGDVRALTPDPPILAFQEVRGSALGKYLAALGRAYPGTHWRAAYQGYRCEYTQPCHRTGETSPADDSSEAGVAVLSPFPAEFVPHVIMASDRWWLGRAAVLATIHVPGYGDVHVLGAHGPVGGSGSEPRFIAEIQRLALEAPSPQFIGVDANVSPTQQHGALYAQLTSNGWRDAWSEFTGTIAGGETKRTRIDYWLAHFEGPPTLHVIEARVGPAGASDHRPLLVRYAAERSW